MGGLIVIIFNCFTFAVDSSHVNISPCQHERAPNSDHMYVVDTFCVSTLYHRLFDKIRWSKSAR